MPVGDGPVVARVFREDQIRSGRERAEPAGKSGGLLNETRSWERAPGENKAGESNPTTAGRVVDACSLEGSDRLRAEHATSWCECRGQELGAVQPGSSQRWPAPVRVETAVAALVESSHARTCSNAHAQSGHAWVSRSRPRNMWRTRLITTCNYCGSVPPVKPQEPGVSSHHAAREPGREDTCRPPGRVESGG